MAVKILRVHEGSLAAQMGLRAGDSVTHINGEEILDEIDYQALSAASRLKLTWQSQDGCSHSLPLHKAPGKGLGLTLDESEKLKPRHCHNKCVFCFIDQLPKGLRDTLYVKDDDWRLSLMMGNYVTLTNVDDAEFERILKRRASPLYISVHATDPELRARLLHNPQASKLMERLLRLKECGLSFHAQIVLCPGLNDGAALDRTIQDLLSLWPACRSLAVVPVGLTAHRQGLTKLKGFDAPDAEALLQQLACWQERALKAYGTRFVYPSDEFYVLCQRALPQDEYYEGYPQIENGVGMLRLLEDQCEATLEELEPVSPIPQNLVIATGISAAPFMQKLVERFRPKNADIRVIPVVNHFFGESITVTGLIVGCDLIAALRPVLAAAPCDRVLISASMLRENSDRFLDDLRLSQVEEALQTKLRVTENTGESLIRALYGMEEV